MKISIKVKTKSKQEKICKIGGTNYVVFIKELPIEGKANKKIIELLAEYFETSRLNVKIILGHKSKDKIIEIK
jgi:hypothetical protein